MNRLLKWLSVLLLLSVPAHAGVLTLRQVKGSAISNAEFDSNFAESYSATHGFAVGDLVYKSGASTWAKAIATAGSTYADGVVVAVPSSSLAYISLHFGQPFTKTAHGLGAAGTDVYLSDSVAGSVTASVTGQLVGQVLDANTIIFGVMGGGGGSGDITDIWACTTGNCSALVAAAGDSLDAGAADFLELPHNTAPVGTDCDAAGEAGRVTIDTDATTGQQVYVCEGLAGWVLQGGAGGGNSFQTIDAPAGTDPVADSGTDTLALTCGTGLTCTGTAGTDTLDLTPSEAGLEGLLDLPDLQGQISDAQIAAGAVDGGSGGEIADASITADDLASDSITEAKLKMVNAATDEQCLTYESTTGDFEWQACAAGSSGVLHTDTTTVGNVTTGEDNLITYSLPAGTLAADGDAIQIEAFGTTSTANENKRVKCYFGSTVVIDSAAWTTASVNDWRVTATVVRTAAATQRAAADFHRSLFAPLTTVAYTTPAETLSGAITIKCTGEATTTDAITQTGLIVHSVGGGGSGGATVTTYSPDVDPSTCYLCDNYNTGTEAATDGNFTGATKTMTLDGMLISTPTNDTAGYNCQWYTPPASGDWVAVTKAQPDGEADTSSDVALAVMKSGSIASPTGIKFALLRGVSAIINIEVDSNASGYVPSAADAAGTNFAPTGAHGYLLWKHDDTANTLGIYLSHDGFLWQKIIGYTSISPPAFVGPCVQNGNFAEPTRGFYEFFRILTDASQTVEPFVIGEP